MRKIDADRLKDAIYTDFWEHFTQCHDSDQTALIDMVMDDIDEMPTITPPNEPLTLEQLREMDGKPVWCKYIGDTTFASRWMIVDCEMNKCSSGEWELPFEDDPDDAYGRTWIAYRCPPEGEANG